MLAQCFKTPADLGISDAEFDALVKVLGMLERGELAYAKDLEFFEGKNGFNMGDYDAAEYNACGTVCCIAGWCDRLFQTKLAARHLVDLPPALNTLFSAVGDFWKITPPQAAIALRSYLTHGEPRWDEALAS